METFRIWEGTKYVVGPYQAGNFITFTFEGKELGFWSGGIVSARMIQLADGRIVVHCYDEGADGQDLTANVFEYEDHSAAIEAGWGHIFDL